MAAQVRAEFSEETVVLVTGANGVIGSAICALLDERGAVVIAADLSNAPGERLASLVEQGAVHYVNLDVTDEASWADCVDGSIRECGAITSLVNNAGIYRPSTLLESTVIDFKNHFDINTLGPMLGMQAYVPRAPRGGSIVNIASTAALTGEAGSAAYSTSKWALRGLSRLAAAEFAPAGIRVNCVLPGVVDSVMALSNSAEINDVTVAATPMHRMASAEDVAHAVAFLLSKDASFLTASELVVDGGFTAAPAMQHLQVATPPTL